MSSQRASHSKCQLQEIHKYFLLTNGENGNLKFELLNGINFKKPDTKKFPVLKLLNNLAFLF